MTERNLSVNSVRRDLFQKKLDHQFKSWTRSLPVDGSIETELEKYGGNKRFELYTTFTTSGEFPSGKQSDDDSVWALGDGVLFQELNWLTGRKIVHWNPPKKGSDGDGAV
jgi:hypothetical protein